MTERPNQDSDDDLLTPREAAAIAGVTPRTVYRYGTDGRVTFVTLPSGHRRYHRGSVQALIGFPAELASTSP